jgi:hypothetical protein
MSLSADSTWFSEDSFKQILQGGGNRAVSVEELGCSSQSEARVLEYVKEGARNEQDRLLPHSGRAMQ